MNLAKRYHELILKQKSVSKTTIKISLFILLIAGIFACNKEEKMISVEVDFKNFNTGVPVENIYYVLFERNSGVLNENKAIVEGVSNSSGKFTYKFKPKRKQKYAIAFSHNPDEWKMIKGSDVVDLKQGELNQIELGYVKEGYLDINYLNENCENENDELRFRYYYTYNAKPQPTTGGSYIYIYIYSFYWAGELSKNGCLNIIGYSDWPQNLPAGGYTIEWKVTRDSGITEGTDTFFVGDSDTVAYVIKY